MKITVVGAGNIGTQFAVHCAEKGHDVFLYTSKPLYINKELEIVDENYNVIHKGLIRTATSDEKEAFADADLIFVTMPAQLMSLNAKRIEPYVTSNTKICLVPGTGGGECAFYNCIRKGATVFGIQRVPSVARLVEYGKQVRAVGYRNELFACALPHDKTNKCCGLIENIFDIKCTPLPNYLNITLTPSNPILHTTRLFNLFNDYHEGIFYQLNNLFYEDWNDETSELLFKCDAEIQQICNILCMFDLSYVKSLKVHYESQTPSALTNKMQSIAGFKGIKSPMIETKNGYIPDFNSRFFTADFSYGLSILIQIADLLSLDVNNMKQVYSWYKNLTNPEDEYSFSKFSIKTKEDLINFYKQ